MAKQITIQKVPDNYKKPRPDFNKSEFEVAIHQKGYEVIHEKALKCPCKSRNSSGQLSNCQNCGGTGWTFINAFQTRMILHSMNMSNQYKDWSEQNVGTASITARDVEEISFMDRITMVDALSIFNEVLFLRTVGSNLFFYTVYNIKEIDFIGLFVNPDEAYRKLEINTDYTFSGNKIVLNASFIGSEDLSITVRYKHNQQYHIIDIPRSTMNTNVDSGGIETAAIKMPIHAIGRVAHYVLDAENLVGNRIIDNSDPGQGNLNTGSILGILGGPC